MKAPLGFDPKKHDVYVAEGFCPYVQNKTYCNGTAGHLEPHWTLHHLGSGATRRVDLPNAVVYSRKESNG